MKVTYYQRKKFPFGNYSLEFIFEDVRYRLLDTILPKIAISSFYSKGLFKRVYNILEAPFRHGDVNHITGDIHYIALLLQKEKSILSIMDCGFMLGKTGLSAFILKTFWLDLPVRKVKYVTTISEYTRQEVLKFTRVNPAKVVVIPVAISEIYKPSFKVFNEANPRILQIGRASNKNFERIVKALMGLSCTLVCIGKLSNEELELLKANGIIYENYFSLTDDEVKNQYEQCDIMMFPSTLEGFGMPIVEAQMVGRAVITSNVTSMPEVAGDGACLVDPYSIEEIRNATLKVINDEVYREELIAKGLENVKRFDPNKIAKQYERLYLDIYSNKPLK